MSLKKLLFSIVVLGLIIFFMNSKTHAAPIPEGTTIYYDNNYTNWSKITIYLYADGGTTNSNWFDDSMVMSHVGNGIYEYTLENNANNYEWMIFRNEYRDKQTVDLRYIGSNHIFIPDSDSGKINGSWYIKDTTKLTNLKNSFNEIDKEWYTEDSYNALKLVIESITIYNNEFLKTYYTDRFVSNYELKVQEVNTAYENLTLSAEKLNNRINELEEKNMNGYTLASIINFREEINNVKNYISTGTYTLETLKNNYDKLNLSYNSLVITTENEELAIIETVKEEIENLTKLINSNNGDIEGILRRLAEIEILYKKLTNQNSDLTETIAKLFEKYINEPSNNNNVNKFISEYLTPELTKLTEILNTENTGTDELINQYKEIEENYRIALRSEGKATGNNRETEQLLEQKNKEENTTLTYIAVISTIIQTITASCAILILLKTHTKKDI